MPSAFLLFTKPAKLVSFKASGRRHLGNHVRRRRAWQRPDRQRPDRQRPDRQRPDRQRPDRQRPSGTSVRHVRHTRPTGSDPSGASARHIRQANHPSHIYNKVSSEKDPSRVRPWPPRNGIEAEKRVRISAGNAWKRAGNGKNRPLESPRKPQFPPKNRLAAAIIAKSLKFISLIFR